MQKAYLMELAEERKQLENEIYKINEELKPYYEKGYDKLLIDQDGYPRQDLDFGELVNYKNLRRQFNEKNNDHKELMKNIEIGMFAYHQGLQNDPNVQKEIEEYSKNHKIKQSAAPIQMEKKQVQEELKSKLIQDNQDNNQDNQSKQSQDDVKAFAVLTEVTQDSPAALAGFQVGDRIITFGSINYQNHENLINLSNFVKNNVNKEIQVRMQRMLDGFQKSYLITNLIITPQPWKGQGVLGCRFKQL